jgi:hypothetical protein
MVKYWRGQEATLQASGGSLASDPFGLIDEPEISAPEQEVQELRGAGEDVRWQDLQRTSVSVEVTGTILAWDLGTYQDLIGYDDAASEMLHDPEVQTFTADVTFEASDGSTKEITVRECYIDGSVPIGGSREEWISMDLTFQGRDIGAITDTDGSA